MEKCQFVSNVNKPEHIDAVTLMWLSKHKNQLTLSPKADGIYTEIKNKTNIFQCEYLNEHNLYLIFDSKKFHIKHNNTLINRMNWIRSLHPIASTLKIPKIYNFAQLIEFIIKDTELLKKYLYSFDQMTSNNEMASNNEIKWYPKTCFWMESDYNLFLEMLDKNIDQYLFYKTDGWIITNNNKTYVTYKYKPKCELTIDILYCTNKWFSKTKELHNVNMNNLEIPNNTIWRCHWDNGLWVPREERFDKRIPNHQFIIDDLEKIHDNYITATDLIGKTNDYDYYYNHDEIKLNLSDNCKNYLESQRNIFNYNINDVLNKNQHITNIQNKEEFNNEVTSELAAHCIRDIFCGWHRNGRR